MPIFLFFTGHWFVSLFCQTFYHHRYAAHGMFTMSPFWERFFHFFAFVGQGSSYLNPRAYGIMHRMHHAYSDTEKDPHSPHFYKDVFRMMWQTKNLYGDLAHGRKECDPQFTQNLPEWKALDRLGDLWTMRILWGVLYTCFYFYFMTNFWVLLLLPIHYLMGPIHGAIVNWCGHKYGYKNFDNGDKSRNTLVWDVLMMGELYQNNHHKFPNRLNFAHRWFELDPAFPITKALSWIRVIRPRAAARV